MLDAIIHVLPQAVAGYCQQVRDSINAQGIQGNGPQTLPTETAWPAPWPG
jgi:hypothetical protein